MMKLWSKRRGGAAAADDNDDDDASTELDVDLDGSFSSDSLRSPSPSAAAFGRSPAEERRRLVRGALRVTPPVVYCCCWC